MYVPPDLYIHNTYIFCGTYVFKKYKLKRVIWDYKYIHTLFKFSSKYIFKTNEF